MGARVRPLIALLGALSNWLLRGGGVESAVLGYRSIPALKIVNALLFGWAALAQSESWTFVGLPVLGMMVGQSIGWGKYIAAMLTGDKMWGFWRMTLRGLLWGAALAIAPLCFKMWALAACFLLAGSMMGAFYLVAAVFIKGTHPLSNHWVISEVIFGFILWSPLILLA